MADQIELEVPRRLDGERVDKTVAALLGLSRAEAARVLEPGVELDGVVVRSSDRVYTGQVIRCSPPEPIIDLQPEELDFEVLYEDDHVIVVNKPAGMVVHPGTVISGGTLAAGLLHRYPELTGVGAADRWGLVHRLDKDTSGALLVARTEESFEEMRSRLRRREIERVYMALVEGEMEAPTGTIEAPIGRDPTRPVRRAISHTGKPAMTHYEVIHYYESKDCTLLRVTLDTGRTHQIRVHLAAIGHPVVGDRTYGATRRDLMAPRTFLHARSLRFTHPVSGEETIVEAPLPSDLQQVLDLLT